MKIFPFAGTGTLASNGLIGISKRQNIRLHQMKDTKSAHYENIKAKSKLFSVNTIFQVIAKNQHVIYYVQKWTKYFTDLRRFLISPRAIWTLWHFVLITKVNLSYNRYFLSATKNNRMIVHVFYNAVFRRFRTNLDFSIPAISVWTFRGDLENLKSGRGVFKINSNI